MNPHKNPRSIRNAYHIWKIFIVRRNKGSFISFSLETDIINVLILLFVRFESTGHNYKYIIKYKMPFDFFQFRNKHSICFKTFERSCINKLAGFMTLQ